MKKTTLILTIILLFTSFLQAQSFQPSKEKLYQSLIGEVYVLTLFVNTLENEWEADEKEYYLEELANSQAWLEEQAESYDQDLRFNNDYFSENEEEIYIKSLSRRNNSRSTIQKAMEELGYENFEDFLDYTSFDFSRNKLKLIFFVKSYNRSHAYNYWSNKDVDLAIVYCKSTYGMMTDQYVISHELLHQFGAWDLYKGESQSTENAERAMELYPNSIMINTRFNKSDLEVDELTAWRIGWHFEFKEVYQSFNPAIKKDKRKIDMDRNSNSRKSIQFDLKKKKDAEN